MSGNDFWTSGTVTGNGKFHSHFSGTGILMKIPFPFSGTGMRVKNSIPDFRDGNWRTVFPGIPGNFREYPGSGIPGILLLQICFLLSRNWYPSDFWSRYTLLREGWMSEMVPKYWHCQI